ncbi:MAG: SpoVR family protein [Alicyclobacillus sp.]|nr:SpoVR family protein [Alicyclobacillus sp.]
MNGTGGRGGQAYPMDIRSEAWREALAATAQTMGLAPYPVQVETVPDDVMAALVASRVPNRFSHWVLGRELEQWKAQPLPMARVVYSCPVYLLIRNELTGLRSLAVYAEALGHADFYRHNRWLASSDNPLQRFRLHARTLQSYEEAYGEQAVAELIRHAWTIRDYPGLLVLTAENGPGLQAWERHVLLLLAEELEAMELFARTKLVNDGWATYCWVQLLRRCPGLERDSVEAARLEAEVLARRTPAAVGYRMFAELVLTEGWEKAREVRGQLNDADFAAAYLSDALVRHFYSAKAGEEAATREVLVEELRTLGRPRLDFWEDQGLLRMVHQFTGRELNMAELRMVLASIQALWRQPVVFTTTVDHQRISLRYERGRLVETTYH